MNDGYIVVEGNIGDAAGYAMRGGRIYVKGNGTLKRLFTKDGVLTGFILIGQVERAGIYTSLIREKVPIDTINFDVLKKNPTLFAYSQNQRRKMLGGVV